MNNFSLHWTIRVTTKFLRKLNGHSKFLHLFVFIRVIRGRICICIFSGFHGVALVSRMTASSCLKSMGLTRWATNPAARVCWTSDSVP